MLDYEPCIQQQQQHEHRRILAGGIEGGGSILSRTKQFFSQILFGIYLLNENGIPPIQRDEVSEVRFSDY